MNQSIWPAKLSNFTKNQSHPNNCFTFWRFQKVKHFLSTFRTHQSQKVTITSFADFFLGRKAVPRCWRLCNPWWKRGRLRCLGSVCPLNLKTTWFSIISVSVMTRVTRVTRDWTDHAWSWIMADLESGKLWGSGLGFVFFQIFRRFSWTWPFARTIVLISHRLECEILCEAFREIFSVILTLNSLFATAISVTASGFATCFVRATSPSSEHLGCTSKRFKICFASIGSISIRYPF